MKKTAIFLSVVILAVSLLAVGVDAADKSGQTRRAAMKNASARYVPIVMTDARITVSPHAEAEMTAAANTASVTAMKPNKNITCERCGNVFVLTGNEQVFYEDSGMPEPKICKNCKKLPAVVRRILPMHKGSVPVKVLPMPTWKPIPHAYVVPVNSDMNPGRRIVIRGFVQK